MDWKKNLTELQELPGRLDEACRKLWDEDRLAAVPLQALADDIKLLLPETIRALKEQGGTAEKSETRAAELEGRLKETEERLAESVARAEAGHAVPRLEQELKLEKERAAALREELKTAREHAATAQRGNAAMEE